MREGLKKLSAMKIFVNDKEIDLLPGMAIRHALIGAGLVEEVKTGKKVYDERLAEQAKMYGGLAKIAVENKNVAALIIWMMTDRYAQGVFGSKYGDTSILDADYQPKPAYYAILNELKK